MSTPSGHKTLKTVEAMKRKFACVVAFLLMTSLAMAQVGKLEFKETSFDFGNIPEAGGDVTHTFEFTNTGDAPVIIQGVSTSCGCTASDWTREPILPGKKGIVSAKYSPMGRPNSFTKTLTVRSNGEPQSAVLIIRGFVTPRERTPEEIYRQRYGDLGLKASYIQVGNVAFNKTTTHEVEVYNFGDSKAKLSFSGLPNYISIKPAKPVIKEKSKGSFTVQFDGKRDTSWGFTTTRLQLHYGEYNPELTLAYSRVEDFSSLTPTERANGPRIGVDRQRVSYDTVNIGEKAKVQFTLRNIGKIPLTIRRIKSSCSCITTLSSGNEIQPGGSVTLDAEFNTTGYRGHQSKQITVITNDPTNATVVLEMVGFVK